MKLFCYMNLHASQRAVRAIQNVLLAFACMACLPSHAKSSSGASSSHTGTKAATHHSGTHSTRATPGVKRDANGKIHRSVAAKDSFKKNHPCPSTGKTSGACPGYVIDHVQALKHGGADAPSNMQWQTTAAAKAKDKVE